MTNTPAPGPSETGSDPRDADRARARGLIARFADRWTERADGSWAERSDTPGPSETGPAPADPAPGDPAPGDPAPGDPELTTLRTADLRTITTALNTAVAERDQARAQRDALTAALAALQTPTESDDPIAAPEDPVTG